jgi:hypothetical protein
VLAATGAGAGRDTPAAYRCLPREAWPEAEPLGCMSPSGKNRGGTPEGERVPLDASRTRQTVCADCVNLSAMVRRFGNTRLSAFCFLYFFFVARVERSETRERRASRKFDPGFRFAPSGLRFQTLIVMKPVTTTGFI